MRRELDLLIVLGSSAVLTVVVGAAASAGPLRVILGLPFILLFPGYALVSALFPRRDDLVPAERLALSMGLSVAVIPLVGLALNYSPWGIRTAPVLASVDTLIALTVAAAAYRRRLLPVGDAFVLAEDRWPQRMRVSAVQVALAAAVLLGLAALAAGAYLVPTAGKNSEGFTEFYVLGPGGMTQAYPSLLTVGDEATVTLGVANEEGRDGTYRIEVRIDGETRQRVDGIVLADGERRELPVTIAPAHPGEGQKVEFLLYKDGQEGVYRSLHLWLDVVGATEASSTSWGR